MSDPQPGKRARGDPKPSLHTVRKWLSGPDAGAERDTNSGRLHQSAVAMVNRNEFPREILLEGIVRHVGERLLAMPSRSLESASRLGGQAWRQQA